jgi:hypothetical protein
MLNCDVDHVLQEFYTLILTRFRTYKIASPPQTKMTSEDNIKGLVSLKFLSPWSLRLLSNGRLCPCSGCWAWAVLLLGPLPLGMAGASHGRVVGVRARGAGSKKSTRPTRNFHVDALVAGVSDEGLLIRTRIGIQQD